jgi:hypothetical protein
MALNGYLVNTTVTITWDGVSQRIPKGTVIDSPAPSGSNLANTIGAGNLTALTAQQQGGLPGVDDGNRVNNMRNGGEPYSPGQN